jgi:hypothetical protein
MGIGGNLEAWRGGEEMKLLTIVDTAIYGRETCLYFGSNWSREIGLLVLSHSL